MNKLPLSNTVLVLCLFFSASVFAQDDEENDDIGTEVINVVRSYRPSVSDAFKVKETPQMPKADTIEKKELAYKIFSVPVASTFTPEKGKASTISRKQKEKTYANYATLGFGNYTSILGELYSSFEVNRTDRVGLFLKHNSSQGGIEDVFLDDKFYNTSLDVDYSGGERDMAYTVDFGALHQSYNWYGLDNTFWENHQSVVEGMDVAHSYFGVSLGGNLRLQDAIFSEGDLRLRYFGDSYSTSELHAVAQPKFQFDLGGQNVRLDFEADYLSGSMEKAYATDMEIPYGYLNLSGQPSVTFQEGPFSMRLGAEVVYSMDMENSESNFFIYPKVEAGYRLVDEYVTAFAGVDGDLQQNTYFNFTQENPFVSPTLFIAPTDRAYDAFGGLKGKLTEAIGYTLKASYAKENNRSFFIMNPYQGAGSDLEAYENANSFGVVYDDMNTLEFFGELQATLNNALSVGVNATYLNYSTDNLSEAWNLPGFKATLFSNFKVTEAFYGSANLFYVGERKDISIYQSEVITLDGYVDANLELGYHINEQLTIFARGNNLFGDNYQRWQNFPVQGIQFLGGATYKFDW